MNRRRQLVHPARTRELVDGMLVGWGISIRRACEALRFDPSSYHYKSRRTGQAALELRIREICETRVRYGYRRVQGEGEGEQKAHQVSGLEVGRRLVTTLQ